MNVQPRPAPGADDEGELLRRVAARDRGAFERLYRIYHRRLARFLMRYADRHGVVDEVVNDTMLAVWNQAATFRGQSRVSTWIIGIAYRRALKALEGIDRRRRLEQSLDAPEPTAPPDTGEVQEWVGRALAQLTPEHRLAIELTYYLGLSCEEAAQVAGVPVNTLKTRMFHARARLRELLPQLGGGPGPGQEGDA